MKAIKSIFKEADQSDYELLAVLIIAAGIVLFISYQMIF